MSHVYFYHRPINEGVITLSDEEARHAVSVRRLFAGDSLTLVDGQGAIAQAKVIASSKRPLLCQIEVGNITTQPAASTLRCAVAIPKGDRAMLMVDMLAQLGVRELMPLRCHYSEAALLPKHLDKYRRSAREAMKQSRQAWQMTIHEERHLDDLIRAEVGYYAHPSGKDWSVLGSKGADSSNRIIAIGPEGGFHENEVQQMQASGWQAVSLGTTILRIETAAVALASLILGYRHD